MDFTVRFIHLKVISHLHLGIEDTRLEFKTSTEVTNKNIALKKNNLDIGANYVLRLSAWKDGGTECKQHFV